MVPYKHDGETNTLLNFYEPSLFDTLSWGFITSGNSGGVDRSAMTTGSNSPSKTKIKV